MSIRRVPWPFRCALPLLMLSMIHTPQQHQSATDGEGAERPQRDLAVMRRSFSFYCQRNNTNESTSGDHDLLNEYNTIRCDPSSLIARPSM